MKVRIVSGALVGVALATLLLAGYNFSFARVLLLSIMTLIVVGMCHEVVRACSSEMVTAKFLGGSFAVLFLLYHVLYLLGIETSPYSHLFPAAVAAALVLFCYATRHSLSAFEKDGMTLVLVLWLVIGGSIGFYALLQSADGIKAIALLVAIVAVNDSAAYFGGRAFGSHKLAPALSPNKTIEGSLVGIVGGLIVFYSCPAWLPGTNGFAVFLLLLLAQAGDLLKSGVKRQVGVKDFGSVLPGHGGLIDRLDGHLAVMAVAPLLLS